MGSGDVLGSRYELRDTIGRGGMGEVYRGFDRSLRREVAIKVLPAHLVGDTAAEARFRREGQLAASLIHPNIVLVYDAISQDGVHAIVMELVEGPNLAGLLGDDGPLPGERAAKIAGSIAAALTAAHDRGLVHRDVKPSNILIAPGDIPRLADFGIARAIDASWTLTGIVHGSAPYIAPEQANGGDVDGRTDVYALGCVLYETLTGRPPFTGDDALGIVYRHLHETPQPPSEVNPAVLPVFDGVVLKALQKDPDERFASADHLRAALLAAAAMTPAMGSAVTTQVLDPDVTGVRPSPPLPGAATQGTGVAAAPSSSLAARWVVIAPLVAAMLLAALVAFWGPLRDLLAGDPAQQSQQQRILPAAPETIEPAPGSEPTSPPPTEPSLPPSPSPEASPTEHITPERAAAMMTATLAEGEAVGAIDPKAAEEVRKRVEDVLKRLEEARRKQADGEDDPADKALDEVGEANKKIGERIDKGEVSAEYADVLYARTEALTQTIVDEFG